MKRVLVLVSVACALAQPAWAGVGRTRPKPIDIVVHPLPSDFDLSQIDGNGRPVLDADEAIAKDPVPPKGTDMHERAWGPVAFEMALLKDGPVLGMGAIGSRKKGVPKLAHIVIDWDF